LKETQKPSLLSFVHHSSLFIVAQTMSQCISLCLIICSNVVSCRRSGERL
jgi:hypothetical protein